jgi:hypothetical protein
VGIGDVCILHVGGVLGRMEYIATRASLVQAFNAEHKATSSEVVVSPEAWELVGKFFTGMPVPNDNTSLHLGAKAAHGRSKLKGYWG